MARRQTKRVSNSANGWDVTIYWDCSYGDTYATVGWTVNQNSYSRTFAIKVVGGSTYNNGSSILVGSEICLYVYKNGSYSQQSEIFYLTAPYKLTISQGTGTTVSVQCNGSAASNGDSIIPGDSLQINISANTGYDLASRSHSNGTYSVSGNITVSATASVKSFALTINAGAGSSITVNRTSSPKKGASTGNLSNNATIYYSDVLKISFSASSGYELKTHTVNGSAFTSGGSHTVTKAVTVISTASALGLIYIDNGATFEPYLVFIDNGASWEQHMPMVDNGSDWDICY